MKAEITREDIATMRAVLADWLQITHTGSPLWEHAWRLYGALRDYDFPGKLVTEDPPEEYTIEGAAGRIIRPSGSKKGGAA